MSSILDAIKPMLAPPGGGVYTVHTGRERRQKVFKALYNVTQDEEAKLKWEESLNNESSDLLLLGVPSDNGGGILRGANWGPLAIRERLYQRQEKSWLDIGDVRVIPHLLHDKYLNQETVMKCREALYQDLKTTLPVSPLSITEAVATEIYHQDFKKKIFAIGGDHSISYPLVKAWLRKQKQHNIPSAIIHFDAHTDLSIDRLGIDFCFGTWARHILDDLASPKHLVQLGIRSTAKERGYWESEVGVKQYWAQEIIPNPSKIAEEIIGSLKKEGIKELYLSFDIDALDAEYASATGTPEEGGISPHHAVKIMEELSEHFSFTAGDLVEVAPFIQSDKKKQNTIEPESTLLSAQIIAEKILRLLS